VTVEVAPTLQCLTGCVYCYENDARAINPELKRIDVDVDSIVKGIEHVQKIRGRMESITFHGGEPLLTPPETFIEILTRLKKMGIKSFGIQTSLYGMSEEYLKIFKQFGMSVGVSFDGPWYNGCPECQVELEGKPGEVTKCPNCQKEVTIMEYDLNRGRGWITNKEQQIKFTKQTIEWIDRIAKELGNVGIITVINKFNGGDNRRAHALAKFYLKRPSIWVRFNPVHAEGEYRKKLLEVDENQLVNTYLILGEYAITHGLKWEPFTGYINSLLGVYLHSCWHATNCDAFHTLGSIFVNSNSQITVCPKLSSKFRGFLQIDDRRKPSSWRTEILKQIPYEMGGCKGCRYWYLCKGGCEADGIDGDIRNRTRFCKVIYSTLEFLEKRLKAMLPNLKTYPDLPLEEQEARWQDLVHDSNENLSLFSKFIRIKRENVFRSVNEYVAPRKERVKVPDLKFKDLRINEKVFKQ